MTQPEVDIIAVAEQNIFTPTFKPPHYKKPNRRVKPLKQLFVDEQKYIKSKEPVASKHEDANSNEQEQLTTPYFKKDAIFYTSIDAPPSIKPVKKYCDITGLKAKYRSPSNGLRYYNGEVYTVVKHMSSGVDQQYLELRNANVVLK